DPAMIQASRLTWPSAAPVVALVEAKGLTLVPRLEGDSAVVVPLPPQRDHLARVNISFQVKDRATNQILDTQSAVFSKYTEGDSLRFYLPPLGRAQYEVELHTVSYIDARQPNGTIVTTRSEDSAFLAIKGADLPEQDQAPNVPKVKRIEAAAFHFDVGTSR